MTDPTTDEMTADTTAPDAGADAAVDTTGPIESELLVEDVSIDGMCGVY